ncbi:MAG TPA: carbohydrate binding domain-containing protein [Vicinamibacterales bacterium]|jgi:beta-glucanase (GH16 family)|nr:carbohydrate binding domain-containing protein [Vicinamibacterales bacterium]
MRIATAARRLIHFSSRALLVAFAFIAASVLAAGPTTATFEGGPPAGFFVFNGGGSTVSATVQVVGEGATLARPGQVGDNGALFVSFTIGDFGGFGVDFAAAGSTGPQDWSGTDGFGFWFHGAATGLVYQAEIFDNRSNPASDTAERFDFNFTDNVSGWRYVRIPFSAFQRATDFQPAGAPNDGLTLTEMWGWAIVLPVGTAAPIVDDVGPIDHVIDAFETGLPAGTDANGVPLGFFTFQGASSSAALATTTTPPAVLPAVGTPNTVLQVDMDVTSFAGFVHNFSDSPPTAWTPQDWTHYEGFALWLRGTGSGSTLFVDLLDNRNPGSTRDDAERWTVAFPDDFTGWRQLRFPFSSFARKDIGNGAPNDGLTLTSVHGWAFGALATGGPRRYFIDEVTLFGAAGVRPLTVGFAASGFGVTEGGVATVAVRLSRPLGDDDPEQVTVDYTVVPGTATANLDYVPVSGTLIFLRGSQEETFMISTLTDLKHEGNETVILRLTGADGVELGFGTQAVLNINDADPFDPNLLDDFETAPFQFEEKGDLTLETIVVTPGDPLALPGQGPREGLLRVQTPVLVDVARVPAGQRCDGIVTVAILSTSIFDARTVNHESVRYGSEREIHRDRKGRPARHVDDFDRDGDLDLVFHFDARCGDDRVTLTGHTFAGQRIVHNGYAEFGRDFAGSQDWTLAEGLSFWFYGTGSGQTFKVQVKDNRAPDAGAKRWRLLWSDEFRGTSGTPPDPSVWNHEIGDGTANNIPGWGNTELQYYTADPANAAHDGRGNLVITARAADGTLACYYGPCQYTSARLTTLGKREVGYGRVEARVRLPRGAGLWPAFWSMGTDLPQVGWPQTGEIDIMEWVGRQPTQIFGTIHGPGYSGGASFGGVRDFGRDISNETHVFAVEREPGEIRWYVDGILYHRATPADVAPNQWVFDHPFFLLLNMAVGGNFGGPVGADTVFPQSIAVDYVRVYGAPDTSERFEAPFVDDFAGWRRLTVPFSSFTRSAWQPHGAPNDGFGRAEVWGYGFVLPDGGTRAGEMLLARVELEPVRNVTVATSADSGPGSLRQHLAALPAGGSVAFAPALAGETIVLTSGPLVLAKDVVIDASAAPGLTLSGNGADRVFIINSGTEATLRHLTVANGFGFDLAGGILNNGSLTLEDSTVRDNSVGAATNEFWKGGGGIYSGDSSTLVVRRSTIRGNTTQLVDGGGLHAFFNATVTVDATTIAGNTAGNVGGGIRSLGNVTVTNSTLSGNTSTAWYGGAAFHTDGVMELVNSTVTANISNAGGPAALFVGTFTNAGATLRLTNSIVSGNTIAGGSASAGCFAGFFGSGPVTLASGGNNVAGDASCNLTASGDQPGTDPLLGALANNGGPTATHMPAPGSPAIDAANPAFCPPVDQRGIMRPQGAACDAGSVEKEPD